jgi:hypothetical protein
MRPVRDLGASFKVMYEVSGLGPGGKTIDWQVRGRSLSIVFDVKNRTKSLIEHMKQIVPNLDRGEDSFRVSAPNPGDLFKDTQEKFEENCFQRQLQGVWIRTAIQEDEQKLKHYFKRQLSRDRIHFVILSDWKNDAYILARNPAITRQLKRIFKLRASKRFVTDKYPRE